MLSLSSRPWTSLTFYIYKRSTSACQCTGKQKMDQVDLISGLLNNICVRSCLFHICGPLHCTRSFNLSIRNTFGISCSSLIVVKVREMWFLSNCVSGKVGSHQPLIFFVLFLTPDCALCRTTFKFSISKQSSAAQLAISTAQLFRFFANARKSRP